MASEEDIAGLRAERDDWRRRAEVAEAVSAERLARAENAERALRAAEAALAGAGARPAAAADSARRPAAAADTAAETAGYPPDPAAGDLPAGPGNRARPATLRERWRRYTETIN